MGIVRGLKKMNDTLTKQGVRSDGPKINWLKLNDGETVKLRFLQELDADSPTYDERYGVGFLAVEHQDPNDFKRRYLCTIEDEGRCVGCERHLANMKGKFGQKSKLYINVFVERANGESEVCVLSQGNGPKSVTPWLLEYAGEIGSITNLTFKMKRTGAGQNDTSYTMTPGKPDATPYDISQHELFDLDKVVYEVPYEQQAAWYDNGGAAKATVEESSTDVEW